MAGDEPYDDPSLTRMKRMFNNQIVRGRANYAKVILSAYLLTYVAYKMTRPATPAEPNIDSAIGDQMDDEDI